MSGLNELSLVGVTASSFVATNTDNLLLLVLLQAGYRRQRSWVLAGYLVAVLLVVLVSLLGIAIGRVVDAGLVGYFGLIPIALGLRMLYGNWRGAGPQASAGMALPGAGPLLGTTAVLLANSSDSLLVLMPLLADTNRAGEAVVVSSYLACSLLWAALALAIGSRRGLAEAVEQRGAKLVPWVLLGVGLYLMLDTATDTL